MPVSSPSTQTLRNSLIATTRMEIARNESRFGRLIQASYLNEDQGTVDPPNHIRSIAACERDRRLLKGRLAQLLALSPPVPT